MLHPPPAARNRGHFARWEPPRPSGLETAAYWGQQFESAQDEFAERRSTRFVAIAREATEPQLIARVSFTQIVRGPFQSRVLGYRIAREFEGRGLMHEAPTAGIGFVFREFKLHRIQAGLRAENTRSARLLARLGFEQIGIARDYLSIGGAWRDHVRTALTDWDFDDAVFAVPPTN